LFASQTLKQPVSTAFNRWAFGSLVRFSPVASHPEQIREIPVLERMGYA
jgi:hypothetical protein